MVFQPKGFLSDLVKYGEKIKTTYADSPALEISDCIVIVVC